VELLQVGWNRLADPARCDPQPLLEAIRAQLQLDPAHPRPQLYGDGFAAQAIVATIQQCLAVVPSDRATLLS